MAGFFGMFDYTKEGPGIDKNAPKKKTFVVFFETFFRNFWKFIPINCLFALINIPILTNGIAYVGITNVMRNTARDKHSFGVSDFFDTIKKNWKQGLSLGIINTVVMLVVAFEIWFFYMSEGYLAVIGMGIALTVLVIFSFMKYYFWTLAITFKFTTMQIIKNSFRFAFANLLKNILIAATMLVIYALAVVLILYVPANLGLFLVILCAFTVFPGFKNLLIQFCVFDSIKKYIIDPYYAQHPDDDIELRRNLGLEIPTEDEDEEDEESEEEE